MKRGSFTCYFRHLDYVTFANVSIDFSSCPQEPSLKEGHTNGETVSNCTSTCIPRFGNSFRPGLESPLRRGLVHVRTPAYTSTR